MHCPTWRYALLGIAAASGVWAVPGDAPRSGGVADGGELQWRIYESDGPVKTFAVAGRTLWFADASGVVSLPLGRGTGAGLEKFEKLGDLAADAATSLVVDAAGSVWIGTTGGVAQREEDHFVNFTAADGLPDNTVNALAADEAGRVWVGTNAGLAGRDGSAWTTYTSRNGLPGDTIRTIIVDGNNRVWAGTERGIACREYSGWKVFTIHNGLSSNNARALGYDPSKQTLWAAVGDEDVNSFDGRTWRIFMTIARGITSIMCDTQSRIWFASKTGMMKYNGWEWVGDPAKIGVPVGQVSCMHRDDAGNLWFGTEKGVLELLNPYPY